MPSRASACSRTPRDTVTNNNTNQRSTKWNTNLFEYNSLADSEPE